jgi:hypothetical protein
MRVEKYLKFALLSSGLMLVAADRGAAQAPPQYAVVDPDISFTTVTTSVTFDGTSGLYTYAYAVNSPTSNNGLIGQIILNVVASNPSAFPATPPPTGIQQDAYTVANKPANGLLPVATVSSPPGFTAWRGGRGEIGWDLAIVGAFDDGSPQLGSALAPGTTTTGFSITSTFPPGQRTIRLLPVINLGSSLATIPPDMLEIDRPVTGPVDITQCTTSQCFVDKACPPTFSWRNHGDYVSCVTHEADQLKKSGLINGNQQGDIVSAAANSTVGQ